MSAVVFTRTESEVLRHRLEMPDCIHEVLVEDDGAWTYDQVAARCRALAAGDQVVVSDLAHLDLLIIGEAAAGSTVLCDVEDAVALGELSRGKALAMLRACRGIEEKLAAVGVEVEVPRG